CALPPLPRARRRVRLRGRVRGRAGRARRRPRAIRARPHGALLRRTAPARPPDPRRAAAPGARRGDVLGARCPSLARARAAGARDARARDRRARTGRAPHAAAVPGRGRGRQRRDEPRGRSRAVPEPAHRRAAPRAGLPDARDPLACGAGASRRDGSGVRARARRVIRAPARFASVSHPTRYRRANRAIASGAKTATITALHSNETTTSWPAEWCSSASTRRPPTRHRTASTMTVIGWWSAIGRIQDGIVDTGTYALDTNVSGKTSMAMPCAACALPDTSPIVTNIHSNANPNTLHRPNARSAWGTSVCSRNPTANPIAVVTARLHASNAVSASARPSTAAERGIGSERNRSEKPCSASSATPAVAPLPANRIVVVTNPGTRKST